jgi:hypothetical protein
MIICAHERKQLAAVFPEGVDVAESIGHVRDIA